MSADGHDDRQRRIQLPKFHQHFQTIHPVHDHVQNDSAVPIQRIAFESMRPIRDIFHIIDQLLQQSFG